MARVQCVSSLSGLKFVILVVHALLWDPFTAEFIVVVFLCIFSRQFHLQWAWIKVCVYVITL